MRFHYAALALLVQLTLGCTQPTPTKQAASEPAKSDVAVAAPVLSADRKLVVAFGDSLYVGYNLAPDRGFAPTLERALAARGIKASVFNAGVSGDTTDAGRQRLAFVLDGLPRKPELVLVGLGGNDMLRGISPDVTRANLDAILGELKKRGIRTMLTGMLAAPNLGPDYAAAFNPIYPDLAKKYRAPLYPFFLDGVVGRRDLLLSDGIHPNDRGIRLVVDHVSPVVAGALGP
jgi:acyl-CoA thioesterase-1